MEEHNENDRQEIYSERVRAGKRTYFFDVKATRSNDYYLTITESKRKYKNDGDGFFYEKHKIFLYKEDFNKFVKGLNDTVDHVKNELMPGVDFDEFDREREAAQAAAAQQDNSSADSDDTSTESSDTDSSSDLKWD